MTQARSGWCSLFASAALALCGCSMAASPGAVSQAPNAQEDSAALATQLREQIGDAPCSSDDQCHTVAWGQKACGGPERWVAWSTQTTNATTVNDLARRLSTARKADHVRSGGVSTCFIQADPGAHCEAQHCQLNTGAPAGPAAPQ